MPDEQEGTLITGGADESQEGQKAPNTVGTSAPFQNTSTVNSVGLEGDAELQTADSEQGKEREGRYLFSLGDRITPKNVPPYKILGEAFNTYISVECNGVVIIIDKHAAHERILFEQMRRIMKAQGGASQLLMVPLDISLSVAELDAASEYKEEIEAVGYEYVLDRANGLVCVSQIPGILTQEQAVDMLVTIVGVLSEGSGSVEATKEHFFEKALYQASCKAATKAGHIDSEGTLVWIVECVLGIPEIRYCPHGRPVAVELSKSQIEKIFKRT